MLFSKSDEAAFKKQYVIQFMATYQAVTYQNNCAKGWANHSQVMPIEDAETLANEAWDQLVKTIGVSE